MVGGALKRVRVPAVLDEVGTVQYLPGLSGEDAISAPGSDMRGGCEREGREEGEEWRVGDCARHWSSSPSTPSCPSRNANSIAVFRTPRLNVRPPACPARGS